MKLKATKERKIYCNYIKKKRNKFVFILSGKMLHTAFYNPFNFFFNNRTVLLYNFYFIFNIYVYDICSLFINSSFRNIFDYNFYKIGIHNFFLYL